MLSNMKIASALTAMIAIATAHPTGIAPSNETLSAREVDGFWAPLLDGCVLLVTSSGMINFGERFDMNWHTMRANCVAGAGAPPEENIRDDPNRPPNFSGDDYSFKPDNTLVYGK